MNQRPPLVGSICGLGSVHCYPGIEVPVWFDKLTLNTNWHELQRIVTQRAVDDPKLSYLAGRELYGMADAEELPLPDNLHPEAATRRRIGERFIQLAFKKQ